jgi:hypothetical protein
VRVVQLGNPTIPSGSFYDCFGLRRASWKTFVIDAYDTPNFSQLREETTRAEHVGVVRKQMAVANSDPGRPPREPTRDEVMTYLLRVLSEAHPAIAYEPRPFMVTPRWAKARLLEWGDRSPLWQARVRGQFPEQGEDSLISLAWLYAAQKAQLNGETPGNRLDDELIAGIDVAEAGEDETVCYVRTRRGQIIDSHAWHGNLRGPVINFLTPYKARLREINFDRAGVGAYFADDFESFGFRNVNGINRQAGGRDDTA